MRQEPVETDNSARNNKQQDEISSRNGFKYILKSLFGDKSTRDMKLIQPVVEK